MGIDVNTLSAAKSFVDETAAGLGAVKGAPCTIKSVEETETGNKVTFEWVSNNGTTETAVMEVKNGVNGESVNNDTGWVDLELTSDFVAYSGYTVSYRKIGNVVEIVGIVSPASDDNTLNLRNELVICTIPPCCCPSRDLYLLCQGSIVATWLLTIHPNGSVCASRYRSGNNGSNYDSKSPAASAWMPFQATFTVG